jgi:hypothetical protein
MEEATGAPSSFADWDPKRLRAAGMAVLQIALCSANIVVHDRAHLGFRAIHKIGNIRSLSGVIWGKFWMMRWRHCWQVGTTSGK